MADNAIGQADGAMGQRDERSDGAIGQWTDGEVEHPCPTATSTARVARVIRTADFCFSRKTTSTRFGVPSSCWSDLNGLKSTKSTNLVAQSTGRDEAIGCSIGRASGCPIDD